MPSLTSTVTAVAALCVTAMTSQVAAHGYLTYPPPRGIEKESYSVDLLKSPTSLGNICRGEPASSFITTVGHQLTLKFLATAPHKGPCAAIILDENLGNPIIIANKTDCAAPGVDHTWPINIPANISGRKVLRWTWEGCHVTPCEHYEQCADINIGGGGVYKETPTIPSNGDDNDSGYDSGYESSSSYTPKPAPSPSPAPSQSYPGTPAPAPSQSYPGTPAPAPSQSYPDTPAPAPSQSYSDTPAPAPSQSYPDTPAPAPAPSQSYPDTPATKTPSSGDQQSNSNSHGSFTGKCCNNGAVRCRGNAVAKCDHGKWVYFPCGTGLVCINSDTVPTCGLPAINTNNRNVTIVY